jgi:hypothetical protein
MLVCGFVIAAKHPNEENDMSTRMRDEKEKRKLSAKDIIIPLLIGTLGAVASIVATMMVPGFIGLEVLFLLVIVIWVTIGYNRRTLRGVLTFPFLYIATAAAALLYEGASPYIGAPFGDFRETEPTRFVKTFSFFVLMLAIWIPLEGISRALFKDMSLPRLGLLDNLGGMMVHLLIGLLIAALLFNGFGYVQRWRGEVTKARLAPTFLTTIRLHYLTQSIWFPTRVPPFYRGALELAETPTE